jgi:predicted nuclease of predicted toxin-antitoxin system
MDFLIDADLPRATSTLIVSHGHRAIDVRDIGMGRAKDPEIAAYAKRERLCLVTGDWGFADIRAFPPSEYQGIVVLGLPDDATREIILNVLGILLARQDIINQLPGRLAVVEKTRIRLRPPL